MWIISSQPLKKNGAAVNLDHVRSISLVDEPNYIGLHFDFSAGDGFRDIEFETVEERDAALARALQLLDTGNV